MFKKKAEEFTDLYKDVNIENADVKKFKQDAVDLFKNCIVNFFGFRMQSYPQDPTGNNYIKFDPDYFPTFTKTEWADYGPLSDKFEGMAVSYTHL